MTREERLEYCKICKNRKMDLEKGLVCKLTGEYADFSDRCANHKYDEKEDKRLSVEQEHIGKSEKIGEWLGFFLFQICAGLLVNLVLVFTGQWPENVGIYYLWQGLIIVPHMIIGIYTVYAFIRRKTNAVFWGYVYLLLCLITNLLSLLFGFGGTKAITSLVWNVIWGVYFILSENVKTLIPKEARTTSRTDWTLAAIGVAMPSVAVLLIFSLAYSA